VDPGGAPAPPECPLRGDPQAPHLDPRSRRLVTAPLYRTRCSDDTRASEGGDKGGVGPVGPKANRPALVPGDFIFVRENRYSGFLSPGGVYRPGITFSGGLVPGGLIDRMKEMIFHSWSDVGMVIPIGGIGA
jgi:hypothetical protein